MELTAQQKTRIKEYWQRWHLLTDDYFDRNYSSSPIEEWEKKRKGEESKLDIEVEKLRSEFDDIPRKMEWTDKEKNIMCWGDPLSVHRCESLGVRRELGKPMQGIIQRPTLYRK